MKKRTIILSSIVAALFFVAIIIPMFISWEKYEPMVIEKVKQSTGYDFALSDGVSFSILPMPSAELRGLKLTNPEFKDYPLLDIERVSVSVNPFSLLFGYVNVSSIIISGGKIAYVTGKNGKVNVIQQTGTDTTAILDQENAEIQSEEGQQEDVLSSFGIDHVSLENVELISLDLRTDTRQTVLIKEAALSFKSLKGPFEADMDLRYLKYDLGISATAKKLVEGQPTDFTLDIEERTTNSTSNIKGQITLSDGVSFSGDVTAKHGNKLFAGKVSASQARIAVTEAELSVDQAKADVNLELSGLGSKMVVASSTIAFQDRIDINALLNEAKKSGLDVTKTSRASAASQGAGQAKAQKTLIPQNITLPGNFKANINISAPGISYNGEQTGNIVLAGAFDNGVMKADLNAFSLPKQSSLNATATLKFDSQKPISDGSQIVYNNPTLSVSTKASSQNLRELLVWFGVPQEQINTNIPNVVSADMTTVITPQSVRFDARDMNIGPTAVNGFALYQLPAQGQTLPLIRANVTAGQLILPDFLKSEGQQSSSDQAASTGGVPHFGDVLSSQQNQIKKLVQSIPYNLDLNIKANDITMGDKSFKNVALVMMKNGQAIDLKNLQIGDHMNTAVNLSANADFSENSSKNMVLSARINSSNIDPLFSAYGVTLPENIPSPLGSMSASLDLNGTITQSDMRVGLGIYGFNIAASAQGVDVASLSVPKKLSVDASHPNSEKALQFIAPKYRAESNLMNKPFSLKANLTRNGVHYAVENLAMNLGPSKINGQGNLDMSGQVPYIKANIAADNLPVKVLLGGRETRTNTASSTAGAGQIERRAGETPWSRDAIDTAALRAINADLNVKAQKFAYGAAVLHDAGLNVSLNNGTLKISEITGDLRDGLLKGNITLSATQANQPILIDGAFRVDNATISSVTNALMGHTTRKLDGGMAMTMDFKAQGVSSAALVNALNGQGRVQLIDPVIKGLDIKAIYETVRNIDSVQGALTGLLQTQMSQGSTQLNSVDKQFQIVNGVIPIDNWDTKSDHAVILSNGKIDLPNWKIDIMNQIQIEKVKDIPAFGMRIYGPLNAPETVMTRQSLEDFMRSRLGDKARDFITDKLISEDIQNKVKDKIGVGIDELLPLGQRRQEPSDQETTPANDNEIQEEPVEQRLIRGLFDQLRQ